MKRALVIGLVLLLSISMLAGCSSGGSGSDTALTGKYFIVAMEDAEGNDWFAMFPEMGMSADEFYIELKSGGKATFMLGADDGDGPTEGTYKIDGKTITITIDGEDVVGTIEGNKITTEIEGTKMVFEKRDGAVSGTAVAKPKPAETADTPETAKTEANTEMTASQEKWNGTWYGFMWVLNAYGAYDEMNDNIYDARMVIDLNNNDEGSMTIYLVDEQDSSVDAKIKTFDPYIQVIDGMFWDMPLNVDVWWLTLSAAHEGSMVIVTEAYVDPDNPENDGFQYQFRFRPYGELWEQDVRDNDLLPPGYDDYVAALSGGTASTGPVDGGNAGSAAVEPAEKPPTDTGDFEFTLDPDAYRKGESGWIYTSTGTMKMKIPEGWEIENSLHATTMAVRSHMGGDMIRVMIVTYSSMLKTPEDRTPENQVMQNYATAEITKDKWGNTDVWYRVTDMSDWVTIAGCAAFDGENYVNFEIRRQKASGSVEEFMNSDAWNTLRTTFELKVP